MVRSARQWGPPLLGMSGPVATSFSAVEQSCPKPLPPFSYVAAAAITSTLTVSFLMLPVLSALLKVCKKISFELGQILQQQTRWHRRVISQSTY